MSDVHVVFIQWCAILQCAKLQNVITMYLLRPGIGNRLVSVKKGEKTGKYAIISVKSL